MSSSLACGRMRRLPAQRVIREQLEPQRGYDMTKTMTLFRQHDSRLQWSLNMLARTLLYF